MAMSDTEMALMMGANQLSAMRPINPGAFSGVEAGMMPPGAQMARPIMPMPPAAPTGQMAPQPMPAAPTGAPVPMDEAAMMKYIQEKARQIRERMAGQGAMSNADMGALEAVMQTMPAQQPSGAMSDRDMMMRTGAR